MRKKGQSILGLVVAGAAFAFLFREHLGPAIRGMLEDRKETEFSKELAKRFVKERPEFYLQRTNLAGSNSQVYFELQPLSKVEADSVEYQFKLGEEITAIYCGALREAALAKSPANLNVFFVRPGDSSQSVFLSRILSPEKCRA